MKSRPMLMNKILAARRGGRREVIGLFGTRRGTGVTFTGLMLAFYMGEEQGRRTAFLECNDHQDMSLIKEAYDWYDEGSLSFSFRNIICHKEVTADRIAKIYGDDYECLIIDFGTDYDSNWNEFLRCSTKIIISGSSPWDLIKLNRFMKAYGLTPDNASWFYFIPQTDEKTALKISKETGQKIWAVPFCKEPTLPTRNVTRFFGKVFLS